MEGDVLMRFPEYFASKAVFHILGLLATKNICKEFESNHYGSTFFGVVGVETAAVK